MIQRVQTIFLLLVAVAMLLETYFPIWTQVNPDQTEMLKLTAWNLTHTDTTSGTVLEQTGTFYLGILAVLAAIIAIYSLSQFKNRTKQMFLNMINSLVMVANLGLIVYLTYVENMDFNATASGAFMIGFYCIVAAMIFNIVANRFIRKDEMLVKSVDRIR
ncbi:DUF4293 domain-containing protein [Echinicola strongylocentroti]|uniref:DUF4293 domain-containing protein n=1 Tax=Echinicola strongylocentroti TaxID=1795355 RepID=A0A2Z4IL16_9BACT|nr:DUF4293 domain-containing protein [Echinicola strongylocentroti]AWW31258.1 DUF4293 domain-containing protein [Echinicola strongylocentroti]